MKKGVFITFEGPDGSGKSTQVALLKSYCEKRGFDVLLTREPGGTVISENIRQIILDPAHKEMCPRTEALLYAASRAQLTEQVIKPALAAGRIVISDRFMDSSIAYQGFARGLGDGVRLINEFAIQELAPDLTFFLDIDPLQGLKRAVLAGKPDRMEQESITFHQTVYEAYRKLSQRYKDRYVNIDASASAEDISRTIVERFEAYVSE